MAIMYGCICLGLPIVTSTVSESKVDPLCNVPKGRGNKGCKKKRKNKKTEELPRLTQYTRERDYTIEPQHFSTSLN